MEKIGIKDGSFLRLIKKSKISKCAIVEVLGTVFIIDKLLAEGIFCFLESIEFCSRIAIEKFTIIRYNNGG